APYLAAKAASYIVDLVYLAMPEYSARRINDPDIILRPFEGKNFSGEHLEKALELSKGVDAVIIGPGIGQKDETRDFIRKFIKSCEKPMVIDADALKAVAEDLNVLKGKSFVLTPHAGEFKILFGEKPRGELEEKAKMVMEKAREICGTILLKGAYDVISDGKAWKYNKTGNKGMTTGGTGDVLAGLVGALLALGNEPLRAAGVGAFLNGLAGDMVKEEMGENFTAMEVVKKVSFAVKWILEF
ncbi:MAG: NAD(P)H-hydrate dehydratase, partial [Thermotogae bacterium]